MLHFVLVNTKHNIVKAEHYDWMFFGNISLIVTTSQAQISHKLFMLYNLGNLKGFKRIVLVRASELKKITSVLYIWKMSLKKIITA